MHLPANTFSARHESRGEITGSSQAFEAITGVADTKGSWGNLGAATSFAYEGFTLYINSNNAAASFMLDIGISDGSNRFIIVPDLMFSAAKTLEEHNLQIFIPVHVPSGAQLSVRAAASTATNGCNICLVGHSANPGGFPGYSRAVAMFTPASSRGAAVDPGGTANTKGAWSQLVASTAVDVAAIFGVIGYNADVARAAVASSLVDIGIGAAASEFVILPDFSLAWGTSYDGPTDVVINPVPCAIPSGTRIAARSACSLNTAGDRTVDVALYGLVP